MVLSTIMLVCWGCTNTWVYQVYSFLMQKKGGLQQTKHDVYKNHAGTLYLHHLWWNLHVLHERRMKEKVISMLWNHQHRGVRLCKRVSFAKTSAKIAFCRPVVHSCIASLCLSTLDSVRIIGILRNIVQTLCSELLAESTISFFCTQHVSKKKKTFKMSNWKFRIYASTKKLGREVHPSSCALILASLPLRPGPAPPLLHVSKQWASIHRC